MPKNVLGPVGVSGRNSPPVGVMTIQYLLNCASASQGGPVEELVVDGTRGPRTIAAVRRFQRHNFGWVDGRVDPGGKTLGALQTFDPYPGEALPLGLVVGKTTGDGTFGKLPQGKAGGTIGAKSGSAADGKTLPGGKGGGDYGGEGVCGWVKEHAEGIGGIL